MKFSALVGALVAGVLAATLAQPAAIAAPAPAASDLKPDPGLVFGRLPNGMTYVLMRNATPPGVASLRMRVGAGSLMERPGQEGLAHFIEHMAFNGSAHVPEGELVKMLERDGLKFGADTNAHTSFDETVYELEAPTTNPKAVEDSLTIMRETAGEITFAPDAIDRERGVVLSEERSRDGPQMHLAHAQFDLFLKGQLAPTRFPIGSVDVLHTAQRDRFVAFYNAWYRPERTTLVMIGDIDVAAMEKAIRAKFGDWRAGGPALPDPDLGSVAQRGLDTHLSTEAGAGALVSAAWASPPDLSADTAALRKAHIVRELGFEVLNRRLDRLAHAEGAPFLGAGAGHERLLKSAELTELTVQAQPGKLAEAMTAAETERRRILSYGVSAAELAREISEYRAVLQTRVSGAATRRSDAIAQGVVNAVNAGEVYVDPAQELALFDAATKDLTPEAVNAALKAAFAGAGPLLLGNAPDAPAGGQAAFEAAFKAAEAAPVSAGEVQVAKAWPYTTFGAPGAVAERTQAKDLGVTTVRFANGVRLVVKPTAFRKDQVLVRVSVGRGRLDLPADRETAAWMAGRAVQQGGLGRLTYEETDQALAGKILAANVGVDDQAFTLSGATRPQDFAVELQLLTAYVSDPGLRPEPFLQLQRFAPTVQAQLASAPGAVMARDAARLLHAGDLRFGLPHLEAMQAARFDDFKAMIAKGLAEGPLEVTIVGDVSVDDAVAQVAATLGALPARAAAPVAAAELRTAFPAGTAAPVQLSHTGRADQGLAFVAWPVGDFFTDMKRARQLVVLKDVLEQRLIEVLREKMGVTYSPQVGVAPSWTFPGYGVLSAQIETPTDKIAAFIPAVNEITADLRDHPITPDQLALALNPEVEQITKQRQTNEYWLSYLTGAGTDPRRLEAARTALPQVSSVTVADIQRLAREVFVDSKAYAIEVRPQAK